MSKKKNLLLAEKMPKLDVNQELKVINLSCVASS